MTKTISLGGKIELIGGGTPKTTNPSFWDGDIPWLSVVDFGGDSRWVNNAEKKITKLGLENSSTKLLDVDDIIISARGTVGELAQLARPMAFNQSCYGVRAREGIDQSYLYYLLKHSIGDLQRQAHGGVFSTITRETFNHIEVDLPNLKTQKRIADVLGTIDEKIVLNRKMNETLEQMGQVLFRHYFIGNPEAKKWERGTVTDFASHSKISASPAKSPYTQFSQYSIPAFDNSMSPEVSMGRDIKSNKYGVVDWSILVSKLNPATPRIWPVVSAQENAVCSTEFQVIVPKKYYSFVYFLLTSREYTDKMAMMTSGTSNSHRRISPADILNYSFNKPSDSLLDQFEAKIKDYIIKINHNRQQIQTLTTLRDTLLPRLISGKMKV
jgi:type I restriction enzyme, S subunit